jgi:4'-phosphopantetheinyl transferase
MNVDNAIGALLDFRTISTGQFFLPEFHGKVPVLENDRVHAWSAKYSDLDAYYENLSAQISRDEREKASRFKKPGDARRFVIRHGILRLVLSDYTHSQPSLIPLVISETGKPGMDPGGDFSELSFSLSHTEDFFVIGITKKYDIGIDIIKMDNQYPFLDTADYLFTEGEKALIEGAEANQQYRYFFRIWAMKEALLKATGGTVQMMYDMDVSKVIHDSLVHDFYTLDYQDRTGRFFIHECDWDHRHHGAFAVNVGK